MAGDFTPDQKRYLEGFVQAGACALRKERAGQGEPVGPDAIHFRPRTRPWRRVEARRSGEFKRESIRSMPIRGSCARRATTTEAGGQLPLAVLRTVLRRAGTGSYMPPAHPERHAQAWQFAGMADIAEKFCGPCVWTLPTSIAEAKNATNDRGDPDPVCGRAARRRQHPQCAGTATAASIRRTVDTRPHARERHFHI